MGSQRTAVGLVTYANSITLTPGGNPDVFPAFPAVFIRAPIVEQVGPGVEVLATVGDRPVLCRQGRVVADAVRQDVHAGILLDCKHEPLPHLDINRFESFNGQSRHGGVC